MRYRLSILLIVSLVFSQIATPSSLALGTSIAVTEQGYDNIGEVLDSMGTAFAHTDITQENLADSGFDLSSYGQIFINCQTSNSSYAEQAKIRLRNWVKSGGALYASDWAAEYITKAFPNQITYSTTSTSSQNITATVIDPGLAWYLNPASPASTLDLVYDLPAWKLIDSVASDTKVYLRGDVVSYTETLKNKPMVVSFNYGKGKVVYTSFHNEAQLTEQQQKLLKYLVLIPNSSSLVSEISNWLKTSKTTFSILSENIGLINQGETSTSFNYTANGKDDLIFAQNWGGSTLKLSLYRPNGTLYSEVESSSPPTKIKIPKASAGKWTYTVTATSVPHANYPYVVLVGKNLATTSVSLKANPRLIKKGRSTVISGKLKTKKGKVVKNKTVRIKRKVVTSSYEYVGGKYKKVYKVTWKLVRKVKTNRKGNYSFKTKPNKTTVYRAEFPAVGNYGASNSKTAKVKVKR